MGFKKDNERQEGQTLLNPIKRNGQKRIQTSRQISDFGKHIGEVRPPIDPRRLIKVAEESDILPALINAKSTNLALFGWGIRYKPEFDSNEASEQETSQATEEWYNLEEVFKYFNLSSSFERILYQALMDKGYLGYGMIEILRNGEGKVCGGEYARACNFRIVKPDPKEEYTDVEIFKVRQKNGKLSYEKDSTKRKFKKFVQIVNGQKVYFKEFGDPRIMDKSTGKYVASLEGNEATEILMLTNHSPYSEYGNPEWLGAVANVLGARKSEEVNLDFFNSGKMIPFAILVEGGLLTQASIDTLESGKGMDNFFKALILEAKPPKGKANLVEKDEKPVSIKVQPLTDTNLKDGLFQEYQKNSRDKIRGTFRLPPIYLGESQDYTRATAEVSKIIAEEQVFQPERNYIADTFNMILTNEMELKYVEMYLKGPQIGDMKELAETLKPFIEAGAVTPNMIIDTLGQILGKDLEQLPEEYGNTPIEILKLQMVQMGEGKKTPEDMTTEEIEKSATTIALSKFVDTLKEYLGDDNVI